MSIVPEDEPLPMPYTHARSVYEAMLKTSRKEQDEHKRAMVVWEGFMTHLFDNIGLATPAYTSILGHLKRMGCIVQLRRGGSTTKSLWELVCEPTPELFQESVLRAKPTTKTAMLEQEVRTLSERLGRIEKALLGGGVSL